MTTTTVHYDHQLLSLTTEQHINENASQRNQMKKMSPTKTNWKLEKLQLFLQIIHFLIVMFYLWAGIVEFINNPPFFDAYGDALSKNKLPEGIFQNDPRYRQSANLRFMDIPIVAIILGYAAVATWLRFKGLSWFMTLSISISFLCFWVVNFWGQQYFDWRYYSSRMTGLELQVSTLTLSGTTILIVLFYSRRKLPFKFKSSLPIKRFGWAHILFNFASIYMIMFTSMLLWFTKMYISWSCFKGHHELMELCQLTNQVQCYPCGNCTMEGIKQCYIRDTGKDQFSCNMRFPLEADELGAFCIFNYNMSNVQFLTIFAYIGGLCVFLSTVSRIGGHYILRLSLLVYTAVKGVFSSKSPAPPKRYIPNNNIVESGHHTRQSVVTLTEELNSPINGYYSDQDVDYSRSASPDLDEQDGGNFFDASCG